MKRTRDYMRQRNGKIKRILRSFSWVTLLFFAMLPLVNGLATEDAYAAAGDLMFTQDMEILVVDRDGNGVEGVTFTAMQGDKEITVGPSDENGIARSTGGAFSIYEGVYGRGYFTELISITSVDWPQNYKKPWFSPNSRDSRFDAAYYRRERIYTFSPWSDPYHQNSTPVKGLEDSYIEGLTGGVYHNLTDANDQYFNGIGSVYNIGGSAGDSTRYYMLRFETDDLSKGAGRSVIGFQKRDKSDDHYMDGVKFEIINDSGHAVTADGKKFFQHGEVVDEGSTSNGGVFFEVPHEGKYIIRETAPYGYIPIDDIHFDTVNPDPDLINTITTISATGPDGEKLYLFVLKDILNSKIPEVEFSKIEIGGSEELPGATLTITSEDVEGFSPVSWTSTDEIKKVYLMPGAYTLTEITAPDGHVKAESIDFRVTADGKVEIKGESGDYTEAAEAKVTMEDDWTKVKISKTDITGEKELGGAKLQVIDKDENIVEEWTSVEGESHLIEKTLVAGETYTLREITAPKGYEIAEDIVFRLTEDGTVQIKGEDGEWADADNNTVIMKDAEEESDKPTTPGNPNTPDNPDKPPTTTTTDKSTTSTQTGTPTDSDAPEGVQTGDDTDLMLFAYLIVAAGALLGITGALKRRNRKT